jgi:quercetin dioxygenase-like cupin family protein
MDISMVYFKPGMRTKPHTHAHDQILYIHEGYGIVATEQEKLEVEAGDIITIPAGVWHWHGARHDSTMAHMAITISGFSDWNVEEKNWKTSYAE